MNYFMTPNIEKELLPQKDNKGFFKSYCVLCINNLHLHFFK